MCTSKIDTLRWVARAHLAGSVLLPLLAAGCGEPPSPVVPLGPEPTASASVAPPELPKITVSAVRVPAGFALDGDTTEWALGAALGRSKLAIAVTAERVLVAAELGQPSPEGFWLSLASKANEMLPVGTWGPGGAVGKIDCTAPGHMNPAGIWIEDDVDPTVAGPPAGPAPAAAAACQAIVDKHAKRQAAYLKRFTRSLRIEPGGVRAAGDEGELVALEGATIAWKTSPGGASVEVSLPLSAPPRLVEAPLTRLFAWARPATSEPPPPDAPLDDANALVLPAPVAFEPFAQVRARAFAGADTQRYVASSRGEAQHRWTGLSYPPGDPTHVEWVRYGRSAQQVDVVEAVLYEKKATLGDVEVGHVQAFGDWLALSKKGEVVQMLELREGLRGVVVRDGEIHAVSYTPGHYTMAYSSLPPSWDVLAIGPDGAVRDPVENLMATALKDPKKGGLGCLPVVGPAGVMPGVETASATFDTFGWKGSCQIALDGPSVAFEMAWKWDPAKKVYTGTLRRAPAPKGRK